MEEKEKNHDIHREGWVKVRPSHIFSTTEEEDEIWGINDPIHFLKGLIRPKDWVRFLLGTIETIEVCGSKQKWVTVVTEGSKVVSLPLYMLDFSEEQKRKIIFRKKISEKYFEKIDSIRNQLELELEI